MSVRRWLQLALSPCWRDAATEDDIYLAYQLLLRRQPDDAGLARYLGQIDRLTIGQLIAELAESPEYRKTVSARSAAKAVAKTMDGELPLPTPGDALDPQVMINHCSIDELNQWADDYYRRADDLTPLLNKPFAFLNEAPEMLQHLGLVLSAMHLGKGMTVLDFGAGSCWLSRMLSRMQLRPICCDVSVAALELGRRLFAEQSPSEAFQPTFLVFDGRRLDLPDESVDRIISFDAFHHVPNQSEVIAEFARVLKPGGVVGFSEPGAHHSSSPQAQFEMRNYRVLENNVVLEDVLGMATQVGFTGLDVSVGAFDTLPLKDAVALRRGDRRVAGALVGHIQEMMAAHAVFFLRKGPPILDSRGVEGLAYSMNVTTAEFDGNALRMAVVVTNTGKATWLTNSEPFGTVRIGTHLYDSTNTRIAVGHSRHDLCAPVRPGESTVVNMTTTIPAAIATVACDLVSEGITWFENEGSRPVFVTLADLKSS